MVTNWTKFQILALDNPPENKIGVYWADLRANQHGGIIKHWDDSIRAWKAFPRGDTGAQGPKGDIGEKGASGTIRVGLVSTVEYDVGASVTNQGTNTDAVFDFKIPRGRMGPAGNVTVGTTYKQPTGQAPMVKNTSTDPSSAVFDFYLPEGEKGATGAKGDKGDTPTVGIGSVTEVQNYPTVTKTDTSTGINLNFGLIRGPQGPKGDTGPQPTLTPTITDSLVSAPSNKAVKEALEPISSRLDTLESLGSLLGTVSNTGQLPTTVATALTQWGIKGVTTNDFAIVLNDTNHKDGNGNALSTRYAATVNGNVLTWTFIGAYASAVPEVAHVSSYNEIGTIPAAPIDWTGTQKLNRIAWTGDYDHLNNKPDLYLIPRAEDKYSIQCTFYVDSNDKLKAWAENRSGYNYSSVVIKAGTWTYSSEVNLTKAGTNAVVGEPNSKLILNGRGLFYEDPPPTSPPQTAPPYTIAPGISFASLFLTVGSTEYAYNGGEDVSITIPNSFVNPYKLFLTKGSTVYEYDGSSAVSLSLPETSVNPFSLTMTVGGSNKVYDGSSAVNVTIPAGFSGDYNDLTNKPTIPAKLPNPNVLSITADGTTRSYDGSSAVSFTVAPNPTRLPNPYPLLITRSRPYQDSVQYYYDGSELVDVFIPYPLPLRIWKAENTSDIPDVEYNGDVMVNFTLPPTSGSGGATTYRQVAEPIGAKDGDIWIYWIEPL